jgi:hypothetical protein
LLSLAVAVELHLTMRLVLQAAVELLEILETREVQSLTSQSLALLEL